MSKKSRLQIDHVLRKYPELLSEFDVIQHNDGITIKKDVGMGRILRKHMGRRRKFENYKKVQNVKLKKSESVNVVRLINEKLFTCPICRNILETPVTVVCGHTFCKDYLNQNYNEKCYECDTEIEVPKSTNIMVQDVVDKWKEHQQTDECSTNLRNPLDPEPRYCLRSRCYEQHSKRINDSYFKNQARGDFINHSKDLEERVLKKSLDDIAGSDLECILCSQCLLDPVTTTCGHTFCRECLARVLDHGLACPLCMAPLKIMEQYRGETLVLTQALRAVAMEDLQERLVANERTLQNLETSSQVPIFICTNAFPKVACPLFIYEPRYRLMARRCVQSSNKRFGMAAKMCNGDKYALFGTLLEIRDCVNLQDGTSILTTIGLRRFKVLNRGEQDGYDTAVVQYIQDNTVSDEKLPNLLELHQRVHNKTLHWLKTLEWRLLTEIERCIGHLPSVESDWLSLPDGPSWTWWLIAILPLNIHLRVRFLSSIWLEKRLLAIEKMLDHLKTYTEAVERNVLNCTHKEEAAEACSYSERSLHMPYQNEQ